VTSQSRQASSGLLDKTGLLRRQANRAGVLIWATDEHDATGQKKN
jgi:hypothetical protein